METWKKFKKEIILNKISLKKISLFLLILLPFAIIIGQAPSDIIVSTISILFLVKSIIKKDWSSTKIKWVKIIFFLWIYLIFASFFSLDLKIALEHSVLFLRFFIFAVALQYWILTDKKLLRPSEVDSLIADSSKARKELGWKPTVNFNDLVKMMVESDLEYIKNNL